MFIPLSVLSLVNLLHSRLITAGYYNSTLNQNTSCLTVIEWPVSVQNFLYFGS